MRQIKRIKIGSFVRCYHNGLTGEVINKFRFRGETIFSVRSNKQTFLARKLDCILLPTEKNPVKLNILERVKKLSAEIYN